MKILQVEASLFHVKEQTDRRTDRRDLKLIIAFSSFPGALNCKNICLVCIDKVPIFEEDVGLNDWVIQNWTLIVSVFRRLPDNPYVWCNSLKLEKQCVNLFSYSADLASRYDFW